MEAVQEDDVFGVRRITLGAPRRWCVWPLIRGLSDLPHITLLQDSPAAIARRFRDGDLDCALLPVIDCLVRPEPEVEWDLPPFKVIPGIGLSTHGDAGSEVLFAGVKPRAIRRVHADLAQGGMLTLAKVVLAERFHATPEFMADSFDGPPADATFLSGDDAFTAGNPLPFRHDIGQLWRQATHLPLVHMVWAVRRGVAVPELRRLLTLAIQKGLDEIDRIAAAVSDAHDIDKETVRRRLADGMQYRIGGAEMDGVRKLIEIAAKHRFCDPKAEMPLC